MQLVRGLAHAAADETESSFRLRPGERAAWFEVSAAEPEMRRWAADAAAAGLSVDVWIALKLEWSVVREDIPRPQLEVVVGKARQETSAPKLAPSDDLRQWLAYLTRGSQPQAEHDLPSVALPARVVGRIPPRLLATKVVDAANEPLDLDAIVVERAAVLEGMTMESWAYRSLAVPEWHPAADR